MSKLNMTNKEFYEWVVMNYGMKGALILGQLMFQEEKTRQDIVKELLFQHQNDS